MSDLIGSFLCAMSGLMALAAVRLSMMPANPKVEEEQLLKLAFIFSYLFGLATAAMMALGLYLGFGC